MELIKMRPENFKKYLDPLDRNSERLYRLTEHILEIARIESHTLKLEKEQFDIYDLIKETINDFTNKSRNKNNNDFRLVYNDNNKIVI
jgi:signal transduction histidine kinase